MEDNAVYDGRINEKKAGFYILLLWVAQLANKYLSGSEDLGKYGIVVFVFLCLPLAFLLQGAVLKVLKKDDVDPIGRDLGRFFGFLIVGGVVASGELIANLVIESGISGFKYGLTSLFLGLSVLFLLRTVFIKLFSKIGVNRWGEEVWKRASGYGDLIIILIAGGVIVYLSGVSTVRLVILTLVVASLRLIWAYVPDDRFYVLREFIQFLGERKLWWMAPIFIVMALLMILVMLTQTTGGSFPFIYAIF